jgi:hypothetical protein
MEFSKPSYSPIFNSSYFKNPTTLKRPVLQSFRGGIRTSFVEFGDGTIQLTASENPTITYLDKNVQLSVQPFRQNNYVVQLGCESIYLPESEPIDGYTIQIFNSQPSPIGLVSNQFLMYNTFYLPKGGHSILFLPQQLTVLKFFKKRWSILIF